MVGKGTGSGGGGGTEEIGVWSGCDLNDLVSAESTTNPRRTVVLADGSRVSIEPMAPNSLESLRISGHIDDPSLPGSMPAELMEGLVSGLLQANLLMPPTTNALAAAAPLSEAPHQEGGLGQGPPRDAIPPPLDLVPEEMVPGVASPATLREMALQEGEEAGAAAVAADGVANGAAEQPGAAVAGPAAQAAPARVAADGGGGDGGALWHLVAWLLRGLWLGFKACTIFAAELFIVPSVCLHFFPVLDPMSKHARDSVWFLATTVVKCLVGSWHASQLVHDERCWRHS